MLSLPKILLLLVIIGVVIYGTRVLGRARKVVSDKDDNVRDARPGKAVDLAKCQVCGNYVDPSAGACDRADCPQR